CLAWFVARSSAVDPDGAIEARIGIFAEARKEYTRLLDDVLHATAYHADVVHASIRAFARFEPQTALDISRMLNTEERRNHALLESAKRAARFTARAEQA